MTFDAMNPLRHITTIVSLVGSVVAGCVATAGSAWGQAFSDDFNRPFGTGLGPNWVERTGDFVIATGGIARSVGGATPSLMTVSGFNTEVPVLTLDLVYPSDTLDVAYGGLVGRYADANNNVFVKVQNTLSANRAAFDGLFFYQGTDGTSGKWPGMTGGEAYQPIPTFKEGRLTMTILGSDVTAMIDTNFDGTPELTYTRGGLPLANLGTEVGMAVFAFNVAVNADNFTAVPEPTTGALAVAALAAGLLATRRRGRGFTAGQDRANPD